MKLRQARKLDKRRVSARRAGSRGRWPWKVGTLLRAVARLRKSWRSGTTIEDRGRPTGLDLDHLDFFAANRLATKAYSASHLAAQRRGRAETWPTPYPYAEIHGQRRRLG